MNTIFLTGDTGPIDPTRRAMLEVLVGEDTSSFSSRESRLVDDAMAHGEVYCAEVEVAENSTLVRSDLGYPGSIVELVLSGTGHDSKRLLRALDAAVQVLLEV